MSSWLGKSSSLVSANLLLSLLLFCAFHASPGRCGMSPPLSMYYCGEVRALMSHQSWAVSFSLRHTDSVFLSAVREIKSSSLNFFISLSTYWTNNCSTSLGQVDKVGTIAFLTLSIIKDTLFSWFVVGNELFFLGSWLLLNKFLCKKRVEYCLRDFMGNGVLVLVHWCLTLPRWELWPPWYEIRCF